MILLTVFMVFGVQNVSHSFFWEILEIFGWIFPGGGGGDTSSSDDDTAADTAIIAVDAINLAIRLVGIANWGTDGITNIHAFPDRELVGVTASKQIYLWNSHTGQHQSTLQHDAHIRDISVNLDGSLLASGGMNGTIRLWNPHIQTHETVLETDTDVGILSVAFSSDGSLLASGSADGTIRLWNPHTQTLEATINGFTNSAILSVAFSPDGSLLASGSVDGTIRLWNPYTQAPQTTISAHTDSVLKIAFSPDGSLLASASADGTVGLWHPQTGQNEATLEHAAPVLSIAFRPDGSLLASACVDGTARLWDPHTSQIQATLGHKSPVRSVVFSTDGNTFFSGSQDSKVRIWEINTEPVSIIASVPSPLTETTLNRSVVTLTLSSRKYANSIFDIRDGVSVSGISGVTLPWHQPIRKSDTEITIDLEFDGNINTDSTLTFIVGAAAIDNYNGRALTVQLTVTATEELTDVDDQEPDTPEDDTLVNNDRIAFESSTPSGYTRVTLRKTGTVWGIPTKYTTDSDVGTVAYMVIAKLVGCHFADAEVNRPSIVYIKRQNLGLLNNFASETVCSKSSNTWVTSWDAVRITQLRFFDETGPTHIMEVVYNPDTGQIEIPGEPVAIGVQQPDTAGGTPTISVSATSPLTESTLHEKILTVTLSGGIYEQAFWDYQKVSVSGITDVTFDDFFDVDRVSDTKLTIQLIFNGNMTADGTLTISVNAGAIANYSGAALTAQISILAVTESIKVSTNAPLTEATLDRSVVTLTLTGRKFVRSIFDIRDGVSVSGISGVTIPWHQPDRESDTEITIELEFDGNITTDGTLTFTVGADAIAGYNGPAFTAQVSVTASRENALAANFPNPFNPETWIPYQLAKPTEVTITIYAVNGTLVRTLSLGHQASGIYQSRSRAAYWDGKNEFGESVASGLYFYTLTAGDFSATRKMLIRK